MVGMTNLYRYYGATIINPITGKAAADSFKGSVERQQYTIVHDVM